MYIFVDVDSHLAVFLTSLAQAPVQAGLSGLYSKLIQLPNPNHPDPPPLGKVYFLASANLVSIVEHTW